MSFVNPVENANFAYRKTPGMKSLKMSWIVHGFALLHFAMAYFSALAVIPDSRLLTLMTLLMVLVICVRDRATLEFTCLSFILVNIAGYYIGMEFMKIGLRITGELLSPLNQAISSLITTEILGWGLHALFVFTGNRFKTDPDDEHYWDTRFRVVVIVVLAIFGIRFLIGTVVNQDLFGEEDMYGYFYRFLQNYLLVLLMFFITLVGVRHWMMPRRHFWGQVSIGAVILLVCTVGGAAVQVYGLPFHYSPDITWADYFRELLVAGALELLLLGSTFVVVSGLRFRAQAGQEQKETRKALFQYQNLKQQVNPHFLFNSLNALDGLVLEERTPEASEYIHKLSGIYRYMLQNEGARLVTLQEEMEYVAMYADLLHVRFPEGLQVITEVRPEDLDRLVVPCAVQLLLENAIKHNSTSRAQPLRVRIYSDGEVIGVENDLQLRKSYSDSHGVGQRYIRQQYADVAGREIQITATETLYRVELPLI